MYRMGFPGNWAMADRAMFTMPLWLQLLTMARPLSPLHQEHLVGKVVRGPSPHIRQSAEGAVFTGKMGVNSGSGAEGTAGWKLEGFTPPR